MKRLLMIAISVLFGAGAHAGMSTYSEVTGKVGDFSKDKVTLEISKGKKVTLPRRYFKELRPGSRVTVLAETKVLRRAVPKHRVLKTSDLERTMFEPAPGVSFMPR